MTVGPYFAPIPKNFPHACRLFNFRFSRYKRLNDGLLKSFKIEHGARAEVVLRYQARRHHICFSSQFRININPRAWCVEMITLNEPEKFSPGLLGHTPVLISKAIGLDFHTCNALNIKTSGTEIIRPLTDRQVNSCSRRLREDEFATDPDPQNEIFLLYWLCSK